MEESGGLTCLVLELVEGETLSGPLPVEKALHYARQVAAALEAAHARHIIHRDLKPANVVVTAQGVVKVLDFGLAKAIWRAEERKESDNQSTVTQVESAVGRITGTPPYLSPEQVRCEGIDTRTDVWAFGCLLYELLTGKRAFQATTMADTMSAILAREPDWDALPATTPGKVRDLLQRCLHKNVAQRVQKIEEAGRVIDDVLQKRPPFRTAAFAVSAVVILAIASVLLLRRPAPLPTRDQWVQLTKMPDPVSQPALSSDGKMLTFIRGPDTFFGPGQVYVKILPDGEPSQLTNDSVEKMSPVFSPDGTRIAYTTVTQPFNWDTWAVPVLGGPPQLLLHNAAALVWSGPRQVLFSAMRTIPQMGIVTAGENRLDQRDVYLPAGSGMAHRSYASPDGKAVLLVEMDRMGTWLPCRLIHTDRSAPDSRVGPVGAGCTFGAWSPDGKWMYVTSNAGGFYHIWRQRFPDGEPEQITSGPTEEEGIAMSPDGRSFVTSVGVRNVSLWLHDDKGERQISRLEGSAFYPRFTADGKKLLYLILKGYPDLEHINSVPGELWSTDLASGRAEPLILGFSILSYDVSPDGQRVVLEAPDGAGKHRLWIAYADRRSPPVIIPNVEGQAPLYGPGGEIFFQSSGGGNSTFAYRVQQDGTGLRKAVEQPIYEVRAIVKKGRWLVASDLVQAGLAFPLAGGAPVVMPGDVDREYWSPEGASPTLLAVATGTGTSFVIPLARGEPFPQVTGGGLGSDQVSKIPGVRRIEADRVVPGISTGVYAFARTTAQRNLYRIPIP